jgi:hypothetical protein
MFTGLLIALLIIGSATVAGAGVLFAAQKRKQLPGGGGASADPKVLTDGGGNLIERGVREVRVGDVITYAGRDFLVEGVVEYDEDGHRWRAARIVDGSDEHWIIAGMERLGSSDSVRLVNRDTELELSGYPPESLSVGDVRFSLDKRGTATARFRGDLGKMPGKQGDPALDTVERCRWWRYESAGDATMIVEQWSGEYRVLRGTRVGDGVLDMIPGS